MTRHSRRYFMGLSGAGIAGLVWTGSRAVAQVNAAQEADLIVVNAKVYTVDPIEPRAEGLAVKGGRFVAVGKTEEIKSLAADERKSLMPGR